jgi:malonyl-CoA O-methyltransferase
MSSRDPDAAGAFALDAARARRAFDRAAVHYDRAAVVQAQVRDDLLRRLELTALAPRVVLDAGSGTAHGARALKRRYPRAQVVAVDFAPGMLRAAVRQQSWRRKFARVCADAAALPLAAASVDLVFSNLLLPWCDPERVLAEFRRVLAPRGLLTFTSLGPDTLRELRGAWASVDADAHVHHFVDMHDLGDALVRAGFAAPVLDVERYAVTYADGRALMSDLKRTGAHNAAPGRPRGLTGRGKLAAMLRAYEPHRQDGRLPATVEVVFGLAWGTAAPAARAADGETAVTLAEFKRQVADRP